MTLAAAAAAAPMTSRPHHQPSQNHGIVD